MSKPFLTRSALQDGSRNDSIQYRRYERMPALESSLRLSGEASGTTRARLDSRRRTLLPRRLHVRSAMVRPRRTATGSGSFLTVLQPAP